MKARVWIIPALILLLVGWLWTISDFTMKRQVTIAAPAAEIRPWLDNLECWREWSPWIRENPAIQVELSQPPSGPGARLRWTSPEGAGELVLLPGETERVDFELTFDEDDAPYQGRFTLREGQAGTRVEWRLSGRRRFYQFGPSFALEAENLVAPTMQNALDLLKSLVEGR